MLNRYFSGNILKPEERLLAEIQDLDDNYAALLACIRRYPVDVIRQCCDAQGNTVLQIVLIKHRLNNSKRETGNGEARTDDATAPDVITTPRSPRRRRWSLLGGTVEKDPATNVAQDLPKLLHFLIHSVYPAIEEPDDFDQGPLGLDVVADSDFLLPQPPTRYNSLVRLPNQHTGQLPLHIACASRQAVPASALEFLVAAFPKAVQSPDCQGNLPLHSTAQHTAPLEALKFLVEQYPDAVRVRNDDGNLPLHLAAAAETYKEDGPTILDSDQNYLQSPAMIKGIRTFSNSENLSTPSKYSHPQRSMSNDEVSHPSLGSILGSPQRSLSSDEINQRSSSSVMNSMLSPRRGTRRFPSNLASSPIPEQPTSQGFRRMASMAPPPPLHCASESFSLHDSCGSVNFVELDGSSEISILNSPARRLSGNVSGSSSLATPGRRSVRRMASGDSHGSASSQSSTPRRGVGRSVSGPPPMAAFCKKPLSQASIEQRDVVRFLVECWPESVHETNGKGQTAEQMATGSAVTLLLQEHSRGPSEVILQNATESPLSTSPFQRGFFMPSPVYHKEISSSSFSVSSSSLLSTGMIKTKRTAPRNCKSALTQGSSQNFTVIG